MFVSHTQRQGFQIIYARSHFFSYNVYTWPAIWLILSLFNILSLISTSHFSTENKSVFTHWLIFFPHFRRICPLSDLLKSHFCSITCYKGKQKYFTSIYRCCTGTIRATHTAHNWPKQSNLSAEVPEICNYDRIIHETKNKESYDQLTVTRLNTGGIRGRRTRAGEKCVESEVQSGASGVWKTCEWKKKKGNPGGLAGKLAAHNLVISMGPHCEKVHNETVTILNSSKSVA